LTNERQSQKTIGWRKGGSINLKFRQRSKETWLEKIKANTISNNTSEIVKKIENCRIVVKMPRAEFYYNYLATAAAFLALIGGVALACRTLGVTRKFARYWFQKLTDANIHPGTVGGARNVKFDLATQTTLECLLWNEVKRNPKQTLQQFANFLLRCGLNVSRRYYPNLICRVVIVLQLLLPLPFSEPVVSTLLL
jgi:hypothetical protein